MQGRKNYSEKLFMNFQLSERIPKDNFYRRLSETLDLRSLYPDTRDLYGRTGNPSIDPVVFFKLMLTGYLENITSDRKLVEHCSMRMDILFFLGYDIDEPLPWHSTLSRTRQLYPTELFESIFNKVFSMCVEKGMVLGHTQAVDSAPIKANASMENLELKIPEQSIQYHLATVSADNEIKKDQIYESSGIVTATKSQLERLTKYQANIKSVQSGPPGANHEKAQLLSNKTHYNPHDPDARISIKPGKARKLNYHCSMSVDAAAGVISHIQADFADGRDSQYLPSIVSSLLDRLKRNDLHLIDVLADTNYSNGYNYQFLERHGIMGWIRVFGKFKPDLEGFTYDLKTDSFTCQAGKNLPFKTIEYNPDGKPMKAYWASRTVCMVCPWKTTCTPGRDSKRIVRTNYENEYQRAYKRQHSGRGRRMKSLRQSTVEPVFGSLTQHYGLSKIPMLGISGAHKTMLMSAVAFNIKKYMKFLDRKPVHAARLEVQKNLKSLLKTVEGNLLPRFQYSFK